MTRSSRPTHICKDAQGLLMTEYSCLKNGLFLLEKQSYRERRRHREREIFHPQTTTTTRAGMVPSQEPEARSLFQSPMWGKLESPTPSRSLPRVAGAQDMGHHCFPRYISRQLGQSRTARTELLLIRDASFAGNHQTRCAHRAPNLRISLQRSKMLHNILILSLPTLFQHLIQMPTQSQHNPKSSSRRTRVCLCASKNHSKNIKFRK